MVDRTRCCRLHAPYTWVILGFLGANRVAREFVWQGMAQVFVDRGRERGFLLAHENAHHRTPIMVS